VTLEEYTHLDSLALGARVRSGDVTALELTHLAHEAYTKTDPHLNAVIEFFTDKLDTSKDLLPLEGPFTGVPFMLKDYGASEAGRQQEVGSRLLKGHVSQSTTYLAERFQQAGLVNLGRTATPEYTLSLSMESILHGATRNPWNPSRLAGGSSGGAAAAVAAGIVPCAHATDAAGSIRIPASACGLVGLKPSRGRVSAAPHASESVYGMSQEFIVSRSVRDTAVMLDLVSAPAPGDPFIIRQPDRPYRMELGAPTGPLRIAWSRTPWGGYAVETEVAAATEKVAGTLASWGHHVEEVTPALDYDALITAACTGWAYGFDTMIEQDAHRMQRTIGEETLEPVTLLLYEHAKTLRVTDLEAADRTFNSVRRIFGEFFQRFDTLLTPTLLRLPEAIGRYSQSAPFTSFRSFFEQCDEAGAFLSPFNVTGQPAISLPLAWSQDGLPIGMQFVTGFGEEAMLIRLASRFEQAQPWDSQRAPYHATKL
jgi:amidase